MTSKEGELNQVHLYNMKLSIITLSNAGTNGLFSRIKQPKIQTAALFKLATQVLILVTFIAAYRAIKGRNRFRVVIQVTRALLQVCQTSVAVLFFHFIAPRAATVCHWYNIQHNCLRPRLICVPLYLATTLQRDNRARFKRLSTFFRLGNSTTSSRAIMIYASAFRPASRVSVVNRVGVAAVSCRRLMRRDATVNRA